MAGCGNLGGYLERAYVLVVYGGVVATFWACSACFMGSRTALKCTPDTSRPVGSYQLCTDALRRSQLMREQLHEHRCEQNFANYPKYDFDSCFNRLRDWLSAMRTSSRVRNYIATAIWTRFNHRGEFGAPQRNDKLMF
jgi:hypothetical protein